METYKTILGYVIVIGLSLTTMIITVTKCITDVYYFHGLLLAYLVGAIFLYGVYLIFKYK
jgi:hypothetical protein